jgi:serine protease
MTVDPGAGGNTIRRDPFFHPSSPPAAVDVFIRDFIDDTGTPHEHAIGESPDVILRTIPSRDPQRDYGGHTDTVERVPVESVALGGTKYVYLRVLNRESVAAVDVPTVVHWAPLDTVHRTETWRAVGGYTFEHVPPGNELTVSQAMVWPPEFGHPGPLVYFALIAWVNRDPDDPLFPFDQTFPDRASFDRFVQQNNNIALRVYRYIPYDANPWDQLVGLLSRVLAWFRRLVGLATRRR